MGKRVLIIGGGPTQVPLLEAALGLGLHAIVADPAPVNAGVWRAHQVVRLGTADPEGLLLAAKDLKVDGVITSTMDSSVPVIGYLNEQLGLRGIRRQAGLTAANKVEAKKAFQQARVPTARCFTLPAQGDSSELLKRLEVRRREAGLEYPLILKPGKGASSQGVYRLDSPREAQAHLEDACRWSQEAGADLLLEEFMVGREVSVEIVVVGDRPVILQLTDKTITPPPVCVEVGHLQPSTSWEDPQLLAQIRDVAERAIRCLGLTDWPCHLELMVTADGPKVVEINPRISGDTIGSHLVPRSTNVSFLELALKAVLGELDYEALTAEVDSFRQCVAVRFVPPVAGKHLKSIRVPNQSKVDAVVNYVSYGHRMGPFLSNYDRLAGYITVAPTREQARSQLDEIFDGLEVETLEG
ncbi:MAG TPA: ATP-grasp domain-containing protein [Armatimonadota bacterium]|jgi:biotin carboxylase